MNPKDLLLMTTACCGVLNIADSTLAQTWTQTSAPSNAWRAVACSVGGNKLVAVGAGVIYTSTNFGITWISNSVPNLAWRSVASSADGMKLVAGTMAYFTNNTLMVSVDSGANWRRENGAPDGVWISLASSADGSKLAAAVMPATTNENAAVHTSADSGMTWKSNNLPAFDWDAMASSSDGANLVAASSDDFTSGAIGCPTGPIFVSTNSGATWTSNSVRAYWTSIAASTDGTRLFATSVLQSQFSGAGTVRASVDSGTTWAITSAPMNESWLSVACSADGTRLVAGSSHHVYTSTNSGATWELNSVSVTSNWCFYVACSADGTKLVAAASTGAIYTSQSTPTPLLNITPSGQNLALSWLVPSMSFVLQQSSNLASANWMDVPNPPVLDLTNLQCELNLPATNCQRFYRLAGRIVDDDGPSCHQF